MGRLGRGGRTISTEFSFPDVKIKCQDPDNAKAGVFQGYLWVVSRPGDDVCFDWRTSRRHGELTTLIEGFDGVLQSDGYEAYAAYERAHPGVAWVGCWAHARRKLIEAQGENPKAVRVALKLIGRLYGVEREWDEADLAAGRERDVAERARLSEQRGNWPKSWSSRSLRSVKTTSVGFCIAACRTTRAA